MYVKWRNPKMSSRTSEQVYLSVYQSAYWCTLVCLPVSIFLSTYPHNLSLPMPANRNVFFSLLSDIWGPYIPSLSTIWGRRLDKAIFRGRCEALSLPSHGDTDTAYEEEVGVSGKRPLTEKCRTQLWIYMGEVCSLQAICRHDKCLAIIPYLSEAIVFLIKYK